MIFVLLLPKNKSLREAPLQFSRRLFPLPLAPALLVEHSCTWIKPFVCVIKVVRPDAWEARGSDELDG
ncbi:hypothetical protein SLEP1_g18225 [Rubroshorea leprosula]|uniref:Uncharacterized protein n=1 Tax=Rubroshorea leprosula TaxID=152421 RepID=A0AAV5J7C3_9ROSI|nr:hypothetical protein SLEP1_g18225 [Rubroshorea leprosula]